MWIHIVWDIRIFLDDILENMLWDIFLDDMLLDIGIWMICYWIFLENIDGISNLALIFTSISP